MRRYLLPIAVLLFLGHAHRYYGYLVDDAYISLRYSRSLVEGDGLVFNPGEKVEGYTNFLWVLIGALFLALKLNAIKLLGWLSMACAIAVLWLTARLEKQTRGSAPSAAAFPLSPVWLLALEGFAYWAWTGLESLLFTLLFTLAVSLALVESRDGKRRGSAFIFVLLALTRPDGGVAFGLSLGASWLAAGLYRGPTSPRRWNLRRPIEDGVIFTVLYGSYFLWRYTYYGALLPNTFYAKVTGGPEQGWNGLINLGQWTMAHPLLVAALLAPLAVVFTRQRARLLSRPEFVALWLITVGWISYVVSVGGDFMPFFRFFLPVLPFCAVLLTATLHLLQDALPARPTQGRRLGPWLALAFAVHAGAGLANEQSYRAFVAHRTTVVGEQVGRYFARLYEANEWLAVNTAGAVPYESGLPTIDMLGLTDANIARHPVYVVSPLWAGHRRGWGAYVLERRPRAVVWYNSSGLAEPHYLGDRQLADDPHFRFFYQLRRTTLPGEVEPTVLTRFLGAPFGDEEHSLAPDLGVQFQVRTWTTGFAWTPGLSWTTVRRAPIVLHAFELRRDREHLWTLRQGPSGASGATSPLDTPAFLDRVISTWRHEARRASFDPEARRRAEQLSARALEHLRKNQNEPAKELLTEASRWAGAGRFALPYQYIANLAVLENNLFLAVHAQQEALRFDPENVLYRRNLAHLLTVPFEKFKSQKSDQ